MTKGVAGDPAVLEAYLGGADWGQKEGAHA